MNRHRTTAIIIIFAICAWLVVGRQAPHEQPRSFSTPKSQRPRVRALPPEPPPRHAPSVTTPAPKISPPVPPEPGPGPLKEDPHKPPQGSVPFDLINGYVVAYGDILMGKPVRADFPKSGFSQAPQLRYWETAVIPFSIHATVPNPERILRVISYFNENTPVRFVPYAGQPDNIVFVPMEGLCISYLGKIGGNQPIYLDDRCSDHEITHELMHALGFIHEHSRLDRDKYVAVNWSNIEPDKQSQFMVAPAPWNDPVLKRPFDFHSVMMYSTTAFARDPAQPVLVPRADESVEPVQNGLSPEDLERLRLLYGGR